MAAPDTDAATLERLLEISSLLTSTLQLDELLRTIMSSASELTGAETSSLLLLDEEAGELTVEVATGAPGEAVMRQRVPAGQGIAGWVVEHGEPADRGRPDARMTVSTPASTRRRASRPATSSPCRWRRASARSA